MKLICSPISPYARKAMILARLSNIDLEEIAPTQDGANGYITGDSPLGKIPTLEWQPGQFLFDSVVICEYLDSLRDVPLLPQSGHARYIQLWQHALGDGLSDAVYNYHCETYRPVELHWDQMVRRYDQSIRNAVSKLEDISPWLGDDWTYGNLAIVCALDYAGYRANHFDWRDAAPQLAKWHGGFTRHTAWHSTYAYKTIES